MTDPREKLLAALRDALAQPDPDVRPNRLTVEELEEGLAAVEREVETYKQGIAACLTATAGMPEG